MEFIEILISHDLRISHDDTDVHILDNKVEDLEGKTAEVYARDKMRAYCNKFLSSHFENLIVLTGAGSSVGIGKTDKKGKTRTELWSSVKDYITEEKLKALCKKIKYPYPEGEPGDIEVILSKAEKAKEYVSGIESVIKKIKNKIKGDCSLELPDVSSHELFLNKITSRKLRDPRAKIFTLNYDTLFEQAANKGITVIDGFSYGNPRSFNGTYFDYDFVVRENSRIEKEENYVPRVMHVYKLHGSLDWEKKDDEIIKTKEQDVKDPLIVYPNYEKYEVSYVQPFFEMMLRFQQELRRKNILLLVIGFSFYDKHIAAVVKEALATNTSFRMLVVSKNISDIANVSEFKDIAQNGNVILAADTFEEFAKFYPVPQIYQRDFLQTKYSNKENSDEE
ncbi:MAG: SIR2 family protein [Candidatus Susulua stagnicola]|nr:SIR2 family protein [Candidatus Susulua stagnicola]